MWHIRDSAGNSIITDLSKLLNEDNYLDIYLDDDFYRVFYNDKIQVGSGALLIEHKAEDDKMSVTLINTDKIQSVTLRPY